LARWCGVEGGGRGTEGGIIDGVASREAGTVTGVGDDDGGTVGGVEVKGGVNNGVGVMGSGMVRWGHYRRR
jgi:hypothetical protein